MKNPGGVAILILLIGLGCSATYLTHLGTAGRIETQRQALANSSSMVRLVLVRRLSSAVAPAQASGVG